MRPLTPLVLSLGTLVLWRCTLEEFLNILFCSMQFLCDVSQIGFKSLVRDSTRINRRLCRLAVYSTMCCRLQAWDGFALSLRF